MSGGRSGAPIGVGIVGCGRAAGLHAAAIGSLPGLRLVALADVDPARSRALAGRVAAAPACHESVGSLLAEPSVELVAVCVPPAEHATVAAAVLAAGRHLLVEKPIAVSLADAEALVHEAQGCEVVAAMGFNLRHHRQVAAARRIVRRGDLGRVHLLRTHWSAGLAAAAEAGPWRRDADRGGGVLFELASHHADLWRHLLGDEIADCRATADGPEDSAVVTARTRRGVLIASSFTQRSSDANDLELIGDAGRLQLGLFRGDGPRLQPTGRAGGGVGPRAAELARSLADVPRQARAARRGGDYLLSYRAQWAAIERAVHGEPAELPWLADGREALRLVLAARDAAQAVAA